MRISPLCASHHDDRIGVELAAQRTHGDRLRRIGCGPETAQRRINILTGDHADSLVEERCFNPFTDSGRRWGADHMPDQQDDARGLPRRWSGRSGHA